MKRKTTELKSGKVSEEVSWYLNNRYPGGTNGASKEKHAIAKNLFHAIRGH